MGLPSVAAASSGAPGDGSYSFDSPSADVFALCPFAIHADVTGKIKVNSLPNSRSITINPGQYATIAKTETRKQVTLNSTGTFHDTTDENGITTEHMTGRNLTWDENTGFVLIIGDYTWAWDDSGNVTQHLTGQGQISLTPWDICAMLR